MITQVRDPADGRIYELETEKPVGGGGEALVYRVFGDASLLAKVYRRPRSDVSAKLAYMLAHPPKNPTAAQNHQAYAWPTALISPSKADSIVGFLMPRVVGMREVFDFYNPGQRRKTSAHFNYRYLMQTARNIAGIMSELHSVGYVVGDVNQRNIFVSDAALVTVLDTDSFQFRDPDTGEIHLCRVRTDGFIAPEAYATGRNDVERTVEQDLFGLAVLIFHLLMEGVHPFQGRYRGKGEPPHVQQSVVAGAFPYGMDIPMYEPVPTAPPFQMLNPELRALFVRSFVEGHSSPSARPTAKEWQKALSRASKELIACSVNEHHYYGHHLPTCPWCARVNSGLPDAFPKSLKAQKETVPPNRSGAVPAAEKAPRRRWRHTLTAIVVAVILLWLLSGLRF